MEDNKTNKMEDNKTIKNEESKRQKGNTIDVLWDPIAKKRIPIMPRIHVSMSDRISFNYFKLFVICGVLFFAIFTVLYMGVQVGKYTTMAKDAVSQIENMSNPITDDDVLNFHLLTYYDLNTALALLVDRGACYEVYKKTDEEGDILIYSFYGLPRDEYKNLFGIAYFSKDANHRLMIREAMDLAYRDIEYKVVFYYNMTEDYYNMWRLLWQMVLLYAVIIVFVIMEGKSDNVKLLAPIKEMTGTVNRLTMFNLNSERLNVEGMKNELKDLALVINQMLDRMESSYETQKKFVSDASHELRTPIAIVKGYAGMLSRWGSKDPEVLQESIEALQNESMMMQDLVEKLLFLSRHDKKTLRLDKELFNMRPVIDEIVKETKMVTPDRRIEYPYVDDVNIYGDKQSLKQAIRVLIENAIKYSTDGDKVIITCRNVNGDCVIGVEDTGIGMTERDMDNIFNRFYRSDDVRNRKIDGHGLGLSIAKLIVLAHAGKINIRSQYTVGTRFLVTIPRPRV